MHRKTSAAPVDRLAVERAHLHVLPGEPHTAALGEERLVNDDQTVRVGSVRYSTPPGHVGTRVWRRTVGEELVIVAVTNTGTTGGRFLGEAIRGRRRPRMGSGAGRSTLPGADLRYAVIADFA
ncbi:MULTISPECIES: hypothetical protein [unclassified Micromonospora]|uniref:Mu transposase domain-containing protein n=1 Tax=unclassified Micromonospora TaxID=2617518 RepID=UPI00098D22B1|nr:MULTISPECIES: hypothetical protein [unclassified Micromonospora]MDI5936756.1 hypothetical protein [Micromonospora sp. DH15]OON28142.1 hypothetical protein BSA16_28250 [Micromonospora sp. Rc5]